MGWHGLGSEKAEIAGLLFDRGSRVALIGFPADKIERPKNFLPPVHPAFQIGNCPIRFVGSGMGTAADPCYPTLGQRRVDRGHCLAGCATDFARRVGFVRIVGRVL